MVRAWVFAGWGQSVVEVELGSFAPGVLFVMTRRVITIPLRGTEAYLPRQVRLRRWPWAAAFKKMQTARINAMEDAKDGMSKGRHNLHLGLSKWAEAHGLDSAERRKDKYTAAWKDFYSNNKRSWPRVLTPIGAEQ